MGIAAVNYICENCIAAGMDKDMPAAIVENAGANSQRKFLGTVSSLPEIVHTNKVKSPAVIIIGKACEFSERYDWFGKKPLRNKRIVVARIKSTKLTKSLEELGCNVIEFPCFKIVPLISSEKNLKDYSWLVFTSDIGVNIFFDYLIERGIDIRELGGIKIACVGIETEKEVKRRGIKADYVPQEYNGAALARGLIGLVKNGSKVLIARAKNGDQDLTRILADAGIAFDDIPIYEKIIDTSSTNTIALNDFDFAAFTSPSAVEGFAKAATNVDFHKIKVVCIGEKTAEVARAYGMEVYVSKEATIKSMVEKISKLYPPC